MSQIISVTKFGTTFGPKGDACLYIRYAVDCDRARWNDTISIVRRKYVSRLRENDRDIGLLMNHAFTDLSVDKEMPLGGVAMYAPRFGEGQSAAVLDLLNAEQLTERVIAFADRVEEADREAKKLQGVRKMAEKEGLIVDSMGYYDGGSLEKGQYDVKVSLRCPLSDANYDSPLAQKWKARGLHSAGGCANFTTSRNVNLKDGEEKAASKQFADAKHEMRGQMRQKLVHACLMAAAQKVSGGLCSISHRSPDIQYEAKRTIDKYGLYERSATVVFGTYETRGKNYEKALPDDIDAAVAAINELLVVDNPERKRMMDMMRGPPEVKVDPVKAEMERRATIEKEKAEKKDAQKSERALRKQLTATWEEVAKQMEAAVSPSQADGKPSKSDGVAV